MSKKATKRKQSSKPAAPTMPSAAEQLQAARREMRQLRELKSLMNTIRRKRLDNEAEGVALARLLVAGTEFVVLSELTVASLEGGAKMAVRERDDALRQLDEVTKKLNPDTV